MLIDWLADQSFALDAGSLIARVRSRHQHKSSGHEKKLITYSPGTGSFRFWYKRHLLTLHCIVKDHKEDIHITSLGMDPGILKVLMEECRRKYLDKIQTKVSIFEHRDGEWQKVALKPIRRMSTVIMDKEVKRDLLADVEQHLSDRNWFIERGFPYRRGYLLYGPPGTGKSSFSLSLAGKYEMDIYTLQLSGVTDSSLMQLFAKIPKNSIILLEDVDAAGINRQNTDSEPKTVIPVTVSGLLNALDGVSTQDDRILIMTTNHIERLDDALIRPGRVDKKVFFGLVDEHIAAQFFKTIFKRPTAPEQLENCMDNKKIHNLAREFALQIPRHIFTPAEVSSFLLAHKASPAKAMSETKHWVASKMLEAKSDQPSLLSTKWDSSEILLVAEEDSTNTPPGSPVLSDISEDDCI